MTEAHRTHNRGKGPDPVGHYYQQLLGEAATEECAEQSHYIFNSSKLQNTTPTYRSNNNCHEGRIRKNYERRRNMQNMRFLVTATLFLMSAAQSITLSNGCQFYPVGEYLRFVRVPENLRVGDKIMTLEVRGKHNLTLESIDKGDDAKYFALSETGRDKVELLLARSLENIVDNDSPQNIMKFRIVCFPAGTDKTPSFLQFTAYIEDLNDHAPKFIHAPYSITVDELTPVGLTVFSGISAVDMDKPNTANSDVHFSIVEGNEDGKFGLESSHNPALIVKRALDFDSGDHEFRLKIMASDRGNPPLSSYSVVTVKVIDNDDLPVAFTKSLYKTQIKEFYPFHNKSIHMEVPFPTPIRAYDQDLALNTSVEYDIVSGNEMGYFKIDSKNGTLYLVREIDREALPGNVFTLQVRAMQTDDGTRMGLAGVEIEVLDLNDCLPQFEVDVYNISIMENLPNGFSVLHIIASDADQGENAEFAYKLEDKTRAFQVDPKTGWLTVRDQSQLDREKMAMLTLKVTAEEKVPNVAFGKMKSYATVEVHLLDANDANPTFIPSNLYKFQVTIDSEIGSVVGQVNAEDPDLGGNGKIVYEIQKPNGTASGETDIPFDIDAQGGYIFLLERPLPKLHYTLLVEASDQPANPSERRYSLAVVQIDVVKAGPGHAPEFLGSPYEFWVGSHVGIGTSVGQVKVNHLDNKYTVYDLLHSYYEGVPFAIEERTGIIAVVDELSKYTRSTYEFEAYVTDSRHTLTTNVTIHIVDPLETASAEGRRDPIEVHVKENVAGAAVADLKSLLRNSLSRDLRGMEFILANYDARDKFAISPEGIIYTLKPLDREEKARHLLTVISQSKGIIQGQGVYEIFVNLDDENDNAPKFDRQVYEAHVRENSNPGTPVQMEHPIVVVDSDEGRNADFSVELKGEGADRFRVDPKTGKLFVGNIPLDREEKHVYTLKLVATDSGGKNGSSKVIIHISDTNDNPPVFFHNVVLDPPELDTTNGPRELLRSASQPISVEISTTEPIRIPETVSIGSRIARVLASDRDSGDNSKIFYRIVSENNNPIGGKFAYLTDKQYLYSRNKDKHFMIDRNTGEISVAKPLKPDTEYALNISASDRGGLRAYTGIKVVVQDVNDHVPKFDRPWYAFELLEGTYTKGEIGKVNAKDGDPGANGEVSYSLRAKDSSEIPFNVDSKTGMIFVEGQVDRETRPKFSFLAVARDKGNPPMESVVDVDVNILDVNDNAPKFHSYMNTVKLGKGKVVPVYRTTIKDSIPPGSYVTSVRANDTDSIANGNGLVLFHLASNHKEFYIDSKNGSISTLTNLDYELQPEYNVTVVASDLGKPSLSSTAWVLIRLINTKRDSILSSGTTGNNNKSPPKPADRMFLQEVYTYYVPENYDTPLFLTKMNVTEKYRKYPTEYHLFGGDRIIENFRIGPKSGEIYVIKNLKLGITYDMLVRAFNPQVPRDFDIRQGSQISDRYLEHNEALIRVEMQRTIRSPPITTTTTTTTTAKPNNPSSGSQPHKPKVVYKTTSTTTSKASSSVVPVVSVEPATHQHTGSGSNSNSRRKTSHNSHSSTTSSTTTSTLAPLPGKKSGHNNSKQSDGYFYAGEIAVLTMSCVVFLGGLVAAISVACIRRKKRGSRHGHQQGQRRLSHIPAIPIEVRLQKQLPSRGIGGVPARPVIFPMALPAESTIMAAGTGESSDNTSDTYTDGPLEILGGGGGHRSGSYLQQQKNNNGLSVCPDCRKIKKPGGGCGGRQFAAQQSDKVMRVGKGVGGGSRGGLRGRETSLPSSNDSGIDGSDGQCHCCQSHHSSSESGREHYEDSLMQNMGGVLRGSSRSFRRKRNATQTPYPPHARSSSSNNKFGRRFGEGVVIL